MIYDDSSGHVTNVSTHLQMFYDKCLFCSQPQHRSSSLNRLSIRQQIYHLNKQLTCDSRCFPFFFLSHIRKSAMKAVVCLAAKDSKHDHDIWTSSGCGYCFFFIKGSATCHESLPKLCFPFFIFNVACLSLGRFVVWVC